MSKTTNKINKLATQHEVIGVKTDCPHFSNIGNLCSRVQNGMMRCDEYLECEFKYIDALKEENKQMKERLNNCEKFFNELGELLNEEVGNAYWTQAILHKIKKIIEINHELAEEHKTIGQDLYAEIKEKENLKEENATLREFLNQYQEEANALKSYETYKVWLNNEYRKENEKYKQYLLNIAMIIEELEQQYDDIKDFTEIKEIKEILNEVN